MTGSLRGREETWDSWLERNSDALDAGYERRFAREVLAKLKSIGPRHATAQYPWRDADGKQRRLDFHLSDPERGVNIGIELDGASKDTDSRKWEDFLERQNSAILVVGSLLRFSNSRLFKNSARIVDTIEKIINRQITWHAAQAAQSRKIDDLQSELHRLRATQSLTKPSVAEPPMTSYGADRIGRLEDELVVLRRRLVDEQARVTAEIRDLEHLEKEQDVKLVNVMAVVTILLVVTLIYLVIQPRLDAPAARFVGPTPIQAAVDTAGGGARSAPEGGGRDVAAGSSVITAMDAPKHVGRDVMACGLVAQVKVQEKRTVINMERAFPDQPLYLVVWKSNRPGVEAKFGQLTGLRGSCVCGVGKVELFNGLANIEIRNPANLRLLNSC